MQSLFRTWEEKGEIPDISELQPVLNLRLSCLDIDSAAMLDVLFLKALSQRITASAGEEGHIYLKQFEIPQIVLFDLLINKLPFVSLAHRIINSQIVADAAGCEELVLLDAGIGRGLQTVSLMRMLQDMRPALRRLTIIGIEPFQEARIAAEESIGRQATTMPFQTVFHPVDGFAEQIHPDILQPLFPPVYDRLLVNSSLTLHHLQATVQRESFFRTIHELGAAAIYLTEPDTDHCTEELLTRSRNAYRHFGAVFQVIDNLAITVKEKNGLKLFFGREIEDIVARDSTQRYERHEPAYRWLYYLKNAGYIHSPFTVPVPEEKNVWIKNSGSLDIGYKETSVLSLIKAVR